MCETPMMKQYNNAKRQNPDAILFFRMGDFYEMFYDDAETASRVLGIALTSRSKGTNAAPMAGVPVKAGDSYLRKLIENGYKVAICEQVEDPQDAKGIVDRDVVRVVTPGTVTEDEVLPAKSNNFLLAICLNNREAGLAWVDISTGQFITHQALLCFLEDEIARISPAECLIPEGDRDKGIIVADREMSLQQLISLFQVPVTCRPDWFFDNAAGKESLRSHFQVVSLEGYCEGISQVGAAGALLHYLKETQKTDLDFIDRIEKYNAGESMLLDRATRKCLEIQTTMRDHRKKGALISVLDQTCTAMGGRMLSSWLASPLTVPTKIDRRQRGVRDFAERPELVCDMRNRLSQIQDLERLCARIAYQRANARDLIGLKKSLLAVPDIDKSIAICKAPILQELRKKLNALDDLTSLLDKSLLNNPGSTLKDGGIIENGYSEELDEIRSMHDSGAEWMKKFELREIERAGIPSLKIGVNKVFGYYIEVTHTHGHKVPQEYIRKQTLKNAERYITPELKEYEEKILSASERLKSLEYELFMQIREEVVAYLPSIRELAQAIAHIDVLCSLGRVARERNYVCPLVDATSNIEIVAGRHPVLDATLDSSFVPNDLQMGPGCEISIITGPNMAGKSTYIRQAALLVLMAQIGSFVPAQKARIGVSDRIFTRIGSADEIARGRSTFLVEMLETANILNNATERSLIVLDEVGRGTSTFDGISLSWAIVEHIQKNINARTLFATHYHEISELSEVFPNIHNYNVSVREWKGELAFLYKIVPGSADKSYGIHVARLAGIPRQVIQRGHDILRNLERHAVDFQSYTRNCFRNVKSGAVDENLFTMVGEEIVDTLANLDINHLTPVEAMQLLQELHREAKQI